LLNFFLPRDGQWAYGGASNTIGSDMALKRGVLLPNSGGFAATLWHAVDATMTLPALCQKSL